MNYCNKCGDPIEQNEKFCNKCGNSLQINQSQNLIKNNFNPVQTNFISKKDLIKNKKRDTKEVLIGVGIGVGVLLIILMCYFFFGNSINKYYFDIKSHENIVEDTETGDNSKLKRGKYDTVVVYDNVYSGVTVNNNKDAYKLIEDDSISQKNNCPQEIIEVENDIIKKYGITAVNLCEMDINFAKELENVVEKVYEEFPDARGALTNLSVANVSMKEKFIAAFMPLFEFATSSLTKNKANYPWVIKTQILLNTSYFFNTERLKVAIADSTTSGHFPPNTTVYSPVAHEFGHYLSFLAILKYYETNSVLLIDENNLGSYYNIGSDFSNGTLSLKMIKEAYTNYKNDTGTTLSMDDWRGTISGYALAKKNEKKNGEDNYIWDETIAEAFHDVYLNGDNAKDASKYIIGVLKSKLGG